MSLLGQEQLSQDQQFQQRVRQAMELTATQVQAEGSSQKNHNNRVAFAKAVLSNPAQYVDMVSEAVVTNPAISITSTDSDIEFTINSLWDALSGVI